MEHIVFYIIFSFIGIGFEVLWTSLLEFMETQNFRLRGESTVWMFFVYGFVYFIIMLVLWLYQDYPWWLRIFIYATLIMVWEYLSGFIIEKLFKVRPWDYSKEKGFFTKKRIHLHGYICLEYFLLWGICGFGLEIIYLFLKAHLIFF